MRGFRFGARRRPRPTRDAAWALMFIACLAIGGCAPIAAAVHSAPSPAVEATTANAAPCTPCMEAYPGACREAHSAPDPAGEPSLVAVEGTAHFVRTLSSFCLDDYYDSRSGIPCAWSSPTNLYAISEAEIDHGALGDGKSVYAIASVDQIRSGGVFPGIRLEEGRRYRLFGGASAQLDELTEEENGRTFGVRAACPFE